MNLTVVVLIIQIVICVWCVILTALIYREKQFFTELGKGVTKKDLSSLLKQIVSSLKNASGEIEKIHSHISQIVLKNQSHFQKMGFIRFNPYGDTGGNQSFCFCLLNQYNQGMIITSLHNRDHTRLYAKEVNLDMINSVVFSKEEKQAFEMATKNEKEMVEKT